jgi:large subunit ribosomal protein L25
MADQSTLTAEKRELSGSAAAGRLRRSGKIPGVVYGADQDNYSVQIDAKEFGNLLRHSASEQILVNLQIEGAKEANKLALIQSVQHHPLKGEVLHVDFNAVNENRILNARVPVELTGEAKGIKEGGILDTLLHDMEVSCLPKDLPEILQFDVSHLGIADGLHIGEATFPEGVTPALDAQVLIAIVNETRASLSETEGGDGGEEVEGEEGEEKEDEEAAK